MNVELAERQRLEEIANRIRIKIVKSIALAGSGHAGGSMSVTEIMTVLYFHEMNIDPNNPDNEDRDRLVLSKGHACLSLYSALAEIGFISEEELWKPYKVDSPLQAHPERGLCPGVDMGTGALGQGLSAGIGMAIGARLKNKKFRVYVIVGDGESAEGQVWEAGMCAAKYRLDNLVAIVDYNKLTLSGKTSEVMPLESLYDKWTAFGWHVIEINGHSIAQLIEAFAQAREFKGRPTCIIAHTVKGHGIPYVEDKVECHSISMPDEQVEATLKYLGCPEEEIEPILSQIGG